MAQAARGEPRSLPRMTDATAFTPTEHTTVRRLPDRAVYERDTIHAILDEALTCHVAFVADGRPFAIPTIHARVGEKLYVHGSQASRMLRTIERGVNVCVTVTLVDGLVLARSMFHHSLNYRSVVVLGRATSVRDADEKHAALLAITDHVLPGRTAEARSPNARELRATTVLAIPLAEASAKARTGWPIDDTEDLALPVWAGVLPLAVVAGVPVADPHTPRARPVPASVTGWTR